MGDDLREQLSRADQKMAVELSAMSMATHLELPKDLERCFDD